MERIYVLLSFITNASYTTYAKISEELNVTSRTIYNDVMKLNKELKENGAQIITKPRYGLRLEVSDSNKYEKFLAQLDKDEHEESVEKRIQLILTKLIDFNQSVKMDDLCDEFYISRSTLKNDLKKIREIIVPYHLTLDFKPYEGIKINGDEKDFRRCLAKIKRLTNQKTNDFDKIEEILKKVFKKYQYTMSDFAFHNLIIHLFIAISRIQSGSVLEDCIKTEYYNEDDFIIAEDIVTELETYFHVLFPENELLYIMIHLGSKKMVVNEQNTVVSAEIYEIVQEMLKEIKHTFHIDFCHDFELITLLALHMTPLKVRLIYNLELENPLMKQIRESFPLAYEMANVASKTINNIFENKLTKDEIAYIALHFNVAIERRKKKKKKNVIVVCGTGRGSAELLAYQIKEKHGNYVNVIKTHESIDFSNVNFQNIDFVLTTVHIKEKIPVPIIEIKNFLNKDEEIIQRYMNKEHQNIIRSYFSKELFLANIKLTEKEEILKLLCSKAEIYKNMDASFYELVLERENIGSTSFGNFIAIPHPYKLIGTESFVITGILKDPILWDGELVQIVFLLSMKESGDENLHLFYKIVSKLLTNKKSIQEITEVQTFEKLLEIIEKTA